PVDLQAAAAAIEATRRQGRVSAPAAMATPDAQQLARRRLHGRRQRRNVVALTLALAAMAFGIFWLVWILVETVRLGIGGLSLTLFTEMTPPPQADTGGLPNAIFGLAHLG